ncbi:MAG: recombinase family protein [Succinivibrio sp.]|jgi:DNA invertase Pin-like site-specific DNA recombinase|nr:recombinase family protein [Succinivibrio sp.]
MLIGYARVSTQDQKYSLEDQVAELKAAGCERVYQEEVSSVDSQRLELENALDYIREGDILVVKKLDRLARSVADTVDIQKRLEAKNAGLSILDMKVDTSTPSGRLQFNLFASIAQFEREVMLERQKVGIAKAKADGKYKGRKPTATEVKNKILEKAHTTKLTRQQIADEVGCGIATVYRILKDSK